MYCWEGVHSSSAFEHFALNFEKKTNVNSSAGLGQSIVASEASLKNGSFKNFWKKQIVNNYQ